MLQSRLDRMAEMIGGRIPYNPKISKNLSW